MILPAELAIFQHPEGSFDLFEPGRREKITQTMQFSLPTLLFARNLVVVVQSWALWVICFAWMSFMSPGRELPT
jgi:hypothetical protein